MLEAAEEEIKAEKPKESAHEGKPAPTAPASLKTESPDETEQTAPADKKEVPKETSAFDKQSKK
jgi:hypothetical protein